MRLYAFVTPIDRQTDVRIPRVKTQLGLQDSADKSLEAYKAASDVAVTELPQTHPKCACLTRLYAFVTPIDRQTDVRIPRVKTQLGLQPNFSSRIALTSHWKPTRLLLTLPSLSSP